ncbi:hypothetical protein FB451DRAFT_1553540 [Mycena latifolia]|nr:hypothetical protein FB451DRAFT_1553540 [Mycena latifolia]
MTDEETASVAREIVFMNCAHLVGITFLYWDHLITLDSEIDLLWKRRKALSSFWFFLNRYFAFVAGMPVAILPFLTLSEKSCTNLTLFRELVIVVTQVIVSVIMVIRVYALFSRSLRVLCFLVGVGLCVLGVTVWSVTGQQGSRPTTIGGCHFAVTQSTALKLAGCWEALFAFDSVIFGLTVYNAVVARRRMGPQSNLHTVVVRDGAMYFGIMALANLANIATYYYPSPVLPGSLATFANCISATMISRLILNLHKHANGGILTERPAHAAQHDIPLGSLNGMLMTQPAHGSQYHPHSRNPSFRDVSQTVVVVV